MKEDLEDKYSDEYLEKKKDNLEDTYGDKVKYSYKVVDKTNAMFEKGGSSDSVLRDICALADRCRILVVVTIAGLKDDGYDEETAAYINGLNDINRKLFEKASIAISMQDGTPVYQKGDAHVLV